MLSIRVRRITTLLACLSCFTLSLNAQEDAATKQADTKEVESVENSDKNSDAKTETTTDAKSDSEKEKDDAKESSGTQQDDSNSKSDETPDSKEDSSKDKEQNSKTDKAAEKVKDDASNDKPSKVDKKEKPKEEPKVEVRVIALSGNYVDKLQTSGIDPLAIAMGNVPMKQKSFFRLCDYLAELADEDDLKYVVFDLSDSEIVLNSAQLDEFTRRMEKLNASGKKTVAWLENASNPQMAIAACCSKVFMADFGGLDISSSALESMYYRDAMDLVGVKASVVRAGDFKGAVEPYTNSEMSSHLRQHYIEMLGTTNAAQVDRLVRGRGLTAANVRELQKQRFLTPNEALAGGLVDKLAPYGSMKKTIDEMIGDETEWTEPKQRKKRQMSFFEVMSSMMSGPSSSSSRIRDNTIAILHLSGVIVDGKRGTGGSIVSGPMVSAIQSLADDDKVKGVVVRVNSPGGSATASESIRQALKSLADKKPTVVSMGSTAASGGYWVSCIGVPIYAEKATITGSIGVFSMKLSFGTLLRRVGVNVETIALDDSAAAYSMDHAWTDEDESTIKKSIDMVYGKFLELVGDSRNLPIEKVHPLAGGRVWAGTQAKAIGLVDEIGGVDDCLAVVAKKAELDDYQVIHRPSQSTGISLLELLGEGDENEIFSGLSKTAVQSLANRGLSLSVTKLLLEDGVNRASGMPTIWLLNPAEISVK